MSELEHAMRFSDLQVYIKDAQGEMLKNQCDEIGRMLAGMIAKSGKFCHVRYPADH